MRPRTLLVTLAALGHTLIAADDRALVAERVVTLTRESVWTRVASVKLSFPAFHPQGLVKIGDTFFVSSVEVTKPTTRYGSPVGGYDRDTGSGVGHLFRIDRDGRLLADLKLTAGDSYHPGGIDYDGEFIWVPLAEYRPNGPSVIYKVSPHTMAATEVFRFPDSIGAIVRNTDDNTLHGVNWGSRRFYRWTMNGDGRVTNANVPPDRLARANPSHYVDYQDCKYLGQRRMLCAGLADLRQSGSPTLRLGGIDLVSLADGRPIHQLPVPVWTTGGAPMTRNPFWVEPNDAGLRVWFLPEDDTATLYAYDVE